MTPFRLISSPNVDRGGWNIYRLNADDTRGELVAIVFDKKIRDLFLSAPALAQIHANAKNIQGTNAQSLRKREYKDSVDSFSEAFMSIVRKIK